MLIKQISVFLENEAGKLAEVLKILADHELDICALSVADTEDYGILRLIVNRPEEAEEVLKKKGYTVRSTDVISISIDDKPGRLAKAIENFKDDGIEIAYIYAFVGRIENQATVILKVNNTQLAIENLTKNGVSVLPAESIYRN